MKCVSSPLGLVQLFIEFSHNTKAMHTRCQQSSRSVSVNAELSVNVVFGWNENLLVRVLLGLWHYLTVVSRATPGHTAMHNLTPDLWITAHIFDLSSESNRSDIVLELAYFFEFFNICLKNVNCFKQLLPQGWYITHYWHLRLKANTITPRPKQKFSKHNVRLSERRETK